MAKKHRLLVGALTAITALFASVIQVGGFSPSAHAVTNEIDRALLLGDASDAGTGTGLSDGLVANGGVIPSAASFTAEAWVYPDSLDNANVWHQVFQQSGSSSSNYGRFDVNLMTASGNSASKYAGVQIIYDGLNLYTGDYGGNSNFKEARVYEDRWTHLAVSVAYSATSATVTLYIDGQQAASLTGNTNTHSIRTDGFTVGYFPEQFDSTDRHFHGAIDQVKVWGGVLNGSQIKQSMHSFSATGVSSAPTLRAHLGFNQNYSDLQGNFSFSTVGTVDQTDVAQSTSAGNDSVVTFPRSYLTSNGGWTAPTGVTNAWLLAVGGGGAGGYDEGGGGGAGLFYENTTLDITSHKVNGSIPITVGSGGRGQFDNSGTVSWVGGGASGEVAGESGNPSLFGNLTIDGGGGGGSAVNVSGVDARKNGGSGGSGGGNANESGNNPGTAGSSTAMGASSFGSAGGVSATPGHGGGGGGAAATGNVNGYGGAGKSSSITGTAVTYAAGGGGGQGNGALGYTARLGGTGGGGNGGTATLAAVAGLDGTGSGGGGSGAATFNYRSGDGGDGIVIVRYSLPVPDAPTITSVTPLDGAVSLAFTAPDTSGKATITDYQYSVDGTAWTSLARTTAGTVQLNNLRNGTAFTIRLRAVTSSGNTATATSSSVTPQGVAYTLTLNNNGSTSTTTYYSGGTLNLTSPTRTGFLLSGWFTAATGGTKVGNGGDTYSPLSASNLVLRYEFDNFDSYPRSGTTVTDIASQVNSGVSGSVNGTLTNGPTFSDVNKMSLNFDGINDYLLTGNLATRVGSDNPVSFFTWVYPTGNGVIVSEIGQTTINSGWHDSQLEMVAGKLKFGIWDVTYGHAITITSDTVPLNTWYYAGLTYSGTTLTAYINGQSVGTQTTTRFAPVTNGNGQYYALGAADSTSRGDGSYGDFRLGSFHVYDAALDASTVLRNYQATCVRFNSACTQQTLYTQWQTDGFNISYQAGSNASGNATTFTKYTNVNHTVADSTNSNSYFSRTGYSIAAWSINSNGSTRDYEFGSTYSSNAALTLYPVWVANTYTVTLNKGSASGATGTNRSLTKTHDLTLALPNSSTANGYFSKTGYNVTGWSVNADGSTTDYALGASYTTEGSATLYPVWTAASYTVTYNYNGANAGNSTSTQTYTYDGIVLSLPSPTKTGYTFAGWHSDSGLSSFVGSANANYIPSANVTLYAKWTSGTYTVLYEYNGATGGNSTTTENFTTGGTALTLPTPTKTGYTFAGWYANSALTTSAGSAGASYSPTTNGTLYSKWTPINYSVSYSTQNSTFGAAPSDLVSYHIGDSVVAKANTGNLVRTGFSFVGWTTASDGSGTLYPAGSSVTVGSSNITFYPKWSANTYTVTYNVNGATGAAARSTDSYTTGDAGLSLPNVGTMVKTGYDFAGWSTSPTGSALSGAYTTTSDVTLYAIWTIKSINFNYERGVAGGTTLSNLEIGTFPLTSTQSGLFGSTITLPATSAVDQLISVGGNQYKFFGWYDGNSTYAAGDTFQLGASASTFIAQWAKLYAVRYGLNGGTGIAAADSECLQADYSCLPNQSITLSAAPNRPGYTFNGWLGQNLLTSYAPGDSVAISDSSYLFYADWTAINYSMTFASNGGSSSPSTLTKNVGNTFTLPSPGTKTGYTFAGWSDGSQVLGAGASYTVATSSVSFSAQWTPHVYAVVYDWQSGTSSTPVTSGSYTVGTGNMALPSASSSGYARDGYVFAGWSTTSGGSTLASFAPSEDDILFAVWVPGNYTLTFDANGGVAGIPAGVVALGTATSLPLPTRQSFTFVGWYDSAVGGNLIGTAGSSLTPSSSRTLYAHWVQNSLYGVDLATLETANTYTTSSSVGTDSTINHVPSGSSARVQIPAGSLPDGTVVTARYFKDYNRQSEVISDQHSYFFALLLSWTLGSGANATVPDTAPGKPITVTLTNANIKAGAMIYQVVGETVTELGRAVVDGSIEVELTHDPEIVVAATVPAAPSSVTGTSGDTRANVSWTAGSTGGSDITSYTVTAYPGGASCSTATTSCTINSLTNNTTYTFQVTAFNALGSSAASASSAAVVPLGASYRVAFNANGGSTIADGSFFSGSTVAAPATPTRSGFSFQGWSTTLNDSTTQITFPYSPGVTSDITLFALWDAVASTPVTQGASQAITSVEPSSRTLVTSPGGTSPSAIPSPNTLSPRVPESTSALAIPAEDKAMDLSWLLLLALATLLLLLLFAMAILRRRR